MNHANTRTTMMSGAENPSIDGDELWTEKQVAYVLGLAPKTVRAWRGKYSDLPFVRLSRRTIRYRRSDVEALVLRNLRHSTSDKGDAQ